MTRQPTVFGSVLRAASQPREVIEAEIEGELNQMLEEAP
jgi:hypothetical protein